MTTKHTVVVGGGVAGLCTAFYLRRLGHDVTLVEGSAVGAPVASSYGNGGWICPAQAGPLPAPGLASHGFRALLNRDSSLYFNPQYLPRLVPWLLRFWTYCNPRDHRAGTAALALLGRDVFELVDDMVASGMEFELQKKGMIVVASEERVARAALEKLEPMRSYGYGIPDSFMDADELHELEPVLSTKAKVGFLIEEQWHVRADSFVASLAGAVAEMGVSVRENTPVTGFKTRDGRVLAATTPYGLLSGDAFALCAGSWTPTLTGKLDRRIPLQPAKGYTFIVAPAREVQHGLLFPEAHAGATPLAKGVRVGGTMEFSGYDNNVDHRRIGTVLANIRQYMHVVDAVPTEPWAGLRPTTADGLPIVDRLGSFDNAYVATGYSMLGMTLSPPAGRALARYIDTGERPEVLEPFRIDRFRWIRRSRQTAPQPSGSAVSR